MADYQYNKRHRSKPNRGCCFIDERDNFSKDLLGLWLFNENAGVKSYDISKRHNNVNLNGGITWSGGPFGTAISLDGTDDVVLGPSSPIVRPSSVTMTAWIYLKTTAAGSFITIVSNRASNAVFGGYLLGKAGGTNNFTLFITTSAAAWEINLNSGFAPVANTWYFVAGTYDSVVGLGSIFVNGILRATATITPASIAYGTDNLRFGAESNGGFLTGFIDQVRLYGRALGVAEIRKLNQDQYQGIKGSNHRYFMWDPTQPAVVGNTYPGYMAAQGFF